jgi:hypothetical protein
MRFNRRTRKEGRHVDKLRAICDRLVGLKAGRWMMRCVPQSIFPSIFKGQADRMAHKCCDALGIWGETVRPEIIGHDTVSSSMAVTPMTPKAACLVQIAVPEAMPW